MNELIRILYDYAFERQMHNYLDDQTQYHESDVMSDRQYSVLQKLLTAEGRQHLEDYIGETRTMHTLELEAMFHAGLSLGQELSRL